jgi:hypothetical protein
MFRPPDPFFLLLTLHGPFDRECGPRIRREKCIGENRCVLGSPSNKWSRYGKEIETARVDQTGCSGIKVIGSSKDTSRKNREIAQTDARRNAAKGVCARRVVGFSRLRFLLIANAPLSILMS